MSGHSPDRGNERQHYNARKMVDQYIFNVNVGGRTVSFPVELVRDLTDTMYNPAMRPYVSHDEGTRLVVEFIEKFWCPTVESRQLLF